MIGDSLSAAYRMETSEAWPALLEARLLEQGYDHRVVNASISGDTTQGGRSRLARALDRFSPQIVVIELGGNDGLRGVAIETTRDNLAWMIETSQVSGAKVILAGMQIPPNYGETYTRQFRDLYPALASQYDTGLIPFFLEGIALRDDLMQEDGIHPNTDAQTHLLDNVWPVLEGQLPTDDSTTNDPPRP